MLHNTRLLVVVIALVLATAVTLIASAKKARSADNDAPCLTREQAKAKWPKAWLYWHTERRCWDNVSGRRYHYHQASVRPSVRTVRPDEFNELDAMASTKQEVIYPTLIPGGGTVSEFLGGSSMTTWPLILDVDNPVRFLPWDERISK